MNLMNFLILNLFVDKYNFFIKAYDVSPIPPQFKFKDLARLSFSAV